jgi:CRISPR/Cas system-associated endonuclease Cas3-HD
MPQIDIDVSGSGPLLTGNERVVIGSFIQEAQEEIAAQISSHVHSILNARIRNPTPYYETQITTQRMQEDLVVHDRKIVYGPWREGISRANARSSFKGYHAFEEASTRTQPEVPRIVLAVMRRYLGRL